VDDTSTGAATGVSVVEAAALEEARLPNARASSSPSPKAATLSLTTASVEESRSFRRWQT